MLWYCILNGIGCLLIKNRPTIGRHSFITRYGFTVRHVLSIPIICIRTYMGFKKLIMNILPQNVDDHLFKGIHCELIHKYQIKLVFILVSLLLL